MIHNKKLRLFSLGLAMLASSSLYAETPAKVIIAPNCLLEKAALGTHQHTLAQIKDLTLFTTDETGIEKLMKAKHQRTTKACGGFFDVTSSWHPQFNPGEYAKEFLNSYEVNNRNTSSFGPKYSINYPDQVNTLIKQLNPQLMWDDLAAFSNTGSDQFPDRYANSKTGVKAAEWLKAKVEALAKENHRDDISSWTVATGSNYKQPSVVVKLGTSNEPGIVVGGHMDTLSGSWSVKPGADDDGSGSMTVMGVARTILQSGMHFKKPIYFIWYSAEEEGLIGSGYVVKDFQKKNIPVDAVVQFDMTGYANQNDKTIWLVTDHVDTDLTNYLQSLIKTYVKQPVGLTHCGYACSDHASWKSAGFKSAFPFEAAFNKDDPYIHTSQDTMAVLSLEHMTDYAKLGIAFAVELAEPV